MVICQLLRVLPLLMVYLLLAGNATAQKEYNEPLTTNRVLSSLYNVSELPQYLPGSYSAQVSSYDTTGGNDDGFSGKYSYKRRNADSSLVLFDVKGTGCINRIWTPTPNTDTLDFFLDGNSTPALSIMFGDLFSGKLQPFMAPLCGNDLGGFYCYFPILFNNGCRIESRGKKIQFHQIQYRLYPPGTSVKSFSVAMDAAVLKELQEIQRVWGEGGMQSLFQAPKFPSLNTKQVELKPGDDLVIFNSGTGGRIESLAFTNASGFEGLNKLVDIEITWDDDTTPAVYCPLADFFGYAFGKPAMQSLLLGTRGDTNYCYIPMPFDKKATIRVRYRKPPPGVSAPAIRFKAGIFASSVKRNTVTEGRFYTSWNRLAKIGQMHVLLNTQARGHYIGTLLQAQGMIPGMTYFFEGDDSTAIDGSMRMHGTGSEDYFNGGWYALNNRWDGKLSLPLHGCLDYSLPYCRTAAYRFYLSDKIAFEKNIFQSIEHGPAGNQVPVDYTSLGFYYAGTAPASFTAPVNESTKVYVPDTLIMYPQLMQLTVENNVSVKTSWAYGTGGLSYTFTAGNESGIKISIAELPLGKYRLLADFVRNAAGADFSCWQGQHNISGWINGNAAEEKVEKNVFVASLEHTPSRNSISIYFKTTPGKDKLILNRLVFVREAK